ncbi:zinc finger, CCHC-type containing protein [Tanacetum coccineum]
MVDSRPVMEQFNALLRILGQYTQHGLKKDESISVPSIIDKFPPFWKDFKDTLKHGKDDLSLVQLGSHLLIEKSLRAQESDKGKGKEVDAIAWWIDSGATTYVCKDRSIHETIAPYTLQQNGMVERKNRALKEMVNSMLSYSGLSEGFWGEAMVVVRLPDPKRKTMGEKVIEIIRMQYLMRPFLFNTTTKGHDTKVQDSQMHDILVSVPNEDSEPRRGIKDIEEDPRTYNEAMQSRDAAFWKEAIDDEIGSIMENNTWVLSDLPPGCKPLGCKWIFKRKMKVDGTIDKFKARLVIQGFRQKEGIDYFDTYAPVARITTIRLLLALAAIHNLVIHQMDVKTTFLNGDLDEEVYMKQPEGFIMPGNKHKLEYSSAIGYLMYAMTSTRPDIAYAVGRLSGFTSNPSRQRWQSITRVFKYLKGTMIYGLSYIGYPSVLEGYSDASWINHVKDLSSTSGWVFLLGGGAISWASKKQTCMTGSTMEFEFVALAAAGKEA